MDIRRERHFAKGIKDFPEDSFIKETEETKAFLFYLDALCDKQAFVPEIDSCSDFDRMGISDKTFPDVFFLRTLAEKKKFDMRKSPFLDAEKSGRDDLGVVPDKDVSGMKVVGNLIKVGLVGQSTRLSVPDQKLAFVAFLGGRLGNSVLWKIIVVGIQIIDIIIKTWCIHFLAASW